LLLYQPSLLLLPVSRCPIRFSAACFVLLMLHMRLRSTLRLHLLQRRRLLLHLQLRLHLLLLQGDSQRPCSLLPALLRRVVGTAGCAAVALWYLNCSQARCERPMCTTAGVQGPLWRR
jgi:hypothetical protein